MDNPKSLFNTNTKVCENCKSPLPYDYKENLCPRFLQNKIQNGKKNWLKTLVRWLIPMEVLLYLE